ncbi:MAG: hypothetical protein OXU50_02395 [Gammaproteobacteria bacterium]|nr:hypothetical protein [Gammaproteobacteria bacterium]
MSSPFSTAAGLSGGMVFAARPGVIRDDEAGFVSPLFHQAVNLWQESDEKDDSAKQDAKKNGGYVLGNF